MSGPMDPERLAKLKALIAALPSPGITLVRLARELLDDRDHWEAEAVRWAAATVRAQNETSDTRERLEAEVERATADIILRDDVAKYYRDRCPVTAADVEAAGVTAERVRDWMSSQGWAEVVPDGSGWESWADDNDQDSEVDVFHERHEATPWLAVRFIADHTDRPAFDILDEIAAMAAMEPKT